MDVAKTSSPPQQLSEGSSTKSKKKKNKAKLNNNDETAIPKRVNGEPPNGLVNGETTQQPSPSSTSTSPPPPPHGETKKSSANHKKKRNKRAVTSTAAPPPTSSVNSQLDEEKEISRQQPNETSGDSLADQLETQCTLDEAEEEPKIVYKEYESEHQMPDIMRLIQKDLSEPYSIYTYRYFIHNWPKLCFLAMHETKCVGAIVCKLDMHRNVKRGYIAMLAVDKDYRKMKIGTTLVTKAIAAMLADNADEVVLETEITNRPALRLYENLGFVRDKRLFHYYLNGVDALRLKLWFR